MKISIVSAWYNEALLAPFFLRHYDYVDEIHIIFDVATTDDTLGILARDPRVTVHPIEYPGGLNWLDKQAAVNKVYGSLTGNQWVFVVDADEFLYKQNFTDLHDYLRISTIFGNQIMWARLYHVFRHFTDVDLDYSKPPLLQRRHGCPEEPEGVQFMPTKAYVKPIVIRAGLNPNWDCGCHQFSNPELKVAKERMDGAHWHMADPTLAVKRRVGTMHRLHPDMITGGLGVQNHHVTEEGLLLECANNMHHPKVIFP